MTNGKFNRHRRVRNLHTIQHRGVSSYFLGALISSFPNLTHIMTDWHFPNSKGRQMGHQFVGLIRTRNVLLPWPVEYTIVLIGAPWSKRTILAMSSQGHVRALILLTRCLTHLSQYALLFGCNTYKRSFLPLMEISNTNLIFKVTL